MTGTPSVHFSLNCRGTSVELGKKTRVMGILNVTPDSFSDGGKYNTMENAVRHALMMEREGADFIDIGGESTRPGATRVQAGEELNRIIPVIEALSDRIHIPISVDTRKATVAEESVKAGASMVNDISGFRFDSAMAETVARMDVPVILMHSRHDPSVMQTHVDYHRIISDICKDLKKSIQNALKAGIPNEHIVIDPGIGFGKSAAQNFSILKHLKSFLNLGYPVMIGVSRKSFIGKTLNLPETERVFGTAAAVAASILQGVHIVRVHDVRPMRQVAMIADSIRGAE
jgi:dihydropteroate synthase